MSRDASGYGVLGWHERQSAVSRDASGCGVLGWHERQSEVSPDALEVPEFQFVILGVLLVPGCLVNEPQLPGGDGAWVLPAAWLVVLPLAWPDRRAGLAVCF